MLIILEKCVTKSEKKKNEIVKKDIFYFFILNNKGFCINLFNTFEYLQRRSKFTKTELLKNNNNNFLGRYILKIYPFYG